MRKKDVILSEMIWRLMPRARYFDDDAKFALEDI